MSKTPEQPATELNTDELDLAVGGTVSSGSASTARTETMQKGGSLGAREEDKKSILAPGAIVSQPS